MKSRGLSLIEVVLAIVILGLLSVSLILFFLSQARFGRDTKERVAATAIAAQFMERLKQVPHAQIPSGSSFDGAGPDPQTPEFFPPAPYPVQVSEGVEYTLRVSISTIVTPGPAEDLKNVFLEVSWPQGKVEMETLCKP